MLSNNVVASFGVVKPAICKLTDVDNEFWFAEINLDLLLKKLRKTSVSFKEISRFPSMRRDLSLLIDQKITFAQIAQAARSAEKKLLKDVGLFDVYIDKKLGDDKKSYAVSFIFMNEEKTLTDKEIDKAMEKIVAAITQSTDGQIR
jgi:phenylalanyl-tRNA synthetase beta chain